MDYGRTERRGHLAMPVLIALALLAAAWPVRAQDESDAADAPREVMRSRIDRVVGVLDDPEYEGEENREKRQEKIYEILLEAVDMEIVGRLVLARHRRDFTDEQFERFKKDFSRLVFATYIDNLEKYASQEIRIEGQRMLPRDKAEVQSRIVGDQGQTPVTFRLAKTNGQWYVYDVLVEGVSMIRNYRSQSADLLEKHSVEEFLERIREKAQQQREGESG